MRMPNQASPEPAQDDRRAPAYSTTQGDLESDRETVIRIWDGILSPAGQLSEKFDAFYLNCPFGRPLLQILHHQPPRTAVGVIAAGPRRMLWRGREVSAGVFAHLAVLPAHRKGKPAVIMQRALLEACRGHFDLVYGLPSALGAAMARLAGYKPIGHLTRYVKVLRYESYLQRKLPQPLALAAGKTLNLAARIHAGTWHALDPAPLHGAWSDTVDPRMQAVWEQSPHGDDLTAIRDVPMLRWRFDQAPTEAKTRFFLVGHARDAPLLAWFSCETNPRLPTMLTITDFWSTAGGATMDPTYIRALCHHARLGGFHALELLFSSNARTAPPWLACGFMERGRRPAFAGWLDPALPTGELRDHIHLTYLDQDG